MKINWHIESRKISEIKEWEKNPRIMTEKGMGDLARSIDTFGLAEPIVVNVDGTVIGGHARFKVLKQRNEVECDCYVPDRQLTEKEVAELNIRLNAISAGEFNWEVLSKEWNMPELIEWGMDVVDFPKIYDPINKEKEIGENLSTENECPSCHYKW